jgi:diguanylate cyclase (GGDEF)-like protein
LSLTAGDLADTDLLRDASEETLRLVAETCQPIPFPAGHVLLSPERENLDVYVLLSGTLGLHFSSPTAPEVRELPTRTSVGEMSVIDATRPSAYVVTKSEVRVLPVHRDLIMRLIRQEPVVARNLLLLMSRWIRFNTERIVLDQQLIWELSGHVNLDPLTGLYNRRWLDNALGRLLEQARKSDRPMSLTALLMDVDRFKGLNDTHGHLAGDRALMALAETLKTTLRPYDFSVRFAGDEFLVLLPATDLPEGLGVAERLRGAVERKRFTLPDGTALPGITISIGVATNANAHTPETLIAAADANLYRAKREGRNRMAGG